MRVRSWTFLVVIALLAGMVADVTAAPLRQYGYFSSRYERTFSEPGLDGGGNTVYLDAPGAWSHPSLNLMFQQQVNDNVKAFLNINGSGAGTLDVRNMWGEYSFNSAFNLRVGKIYRTLGLYNEILDAVPMYIGIEAPELFDADHLMVSRTTQLMAYGSHELGDGSLRYTLSMDNGEGEPVLDVYPLCLDLRYSTGNDQLTFGTSLYSSNGALTPDKSPGEGSPKGGILPWMAEDNFKVFGGYTQLNAKSWIVQFEYWQSPHDAVRDASLVVDVVNSAGVNEAQLDRFLLDVTRAPDDTNVRVPVKFDVKTWYLRSGYSFTSNAGEWVPYMQWDWYSNPETIAAKTWGGDNEAGVADDGKFNKATLGLIFRPVPQVALKLDGSTHMYKFNGKNEKYSEVRFDISYVFGL